jgi:hypothetical protein
MKTTFTGSASLLEKERRASVERPLTSLIPKISAEGNEADTETAIFGVETGSSISSTDSTWVIVYQRVYSQVASRNLQLPQSGQQRLTPEARAISTW